MHIIILTWNIKDIGSTKNKIRIYVKVNLCFSYVLTYMLYTLNSSPVGLCGKVRIYPSKNNFKQAYMVTKKGQGSASDNNVVGSGWGFN